jgi:hypothetical protein
LARATVSSARREAVADRLQSDGGLVIDELDLTAEESLLDWRCR